MSDELVSVYESQGPLGAEVVLAKLRSEGIPAVARFESVGRALGITVADQGLTRVLVAPDDAARARELLEEVPDIDLAGGDASACGGPCGDEPCGETEPDEPA